MGCGSSQPKARPKHIQNDEPPIDPIDTPDWDNSYPPPTPPSEGKDAIFDERQYVDKDRKAAAVPGNFDSYESLLDALTKDSESDIDTARAIFVWLFNLDILNTFYNGVTDPHTPRGYMKLIKAGTSTYEAFFAILCRAAKIPCAIVHGLGKGDNYLVGQTETSGMKSTCHAVYLKGSWRLVHLGWAYLNEKLNHTKNEVESNDSQGTKRDKINEFFWLTDPSKLIYFCFPMDKSWQLLNIPWDLNGYQQSPQLTEDYFTSGLNMTKGTKAIINSKHGVCSIIFDHNKKHGSEIKLAGRLKNENGDEDSVDMDQYIITTGTESSKDLFIRFPDTGVFYLDVYGGQSNDNSTTIAKFRLDCKKVCKPVHPFPFHPKDGFTVVPNLHDLGISSIKPTNGVVYVKPKSIKEFQLTLSRELHIDAKMFHVNKALGSLEQFMEVVNDLEGGQAWVKVAIPDEQHVEYALQLSASDPATGGDLYRPVANYLLVHNSWPHPPSKGKPETVVPVEDDARRKLKEATKSGDIDTLELAIQEFKSNGLEDEGDLTKALNVLLNMYLDNLRSATDSRQLKAISAAIVRANKSCLADVIEPTEEMEEARLAQRQLLKLKLILHKVLELKPRTISEIHSYPRPRILIHNVMRATYRILGEPDENVKSWQSVKSLTKQIGINSIINRIKRFDIIYLTDDCVEDAEACLEKTNRYAVRIVSAGAGTFYSWSKSVLSQYQTMSQEMQSRKSTRLSLVDQERTDSVPNHVTGDAEW